MVNEIMITLISAGGLQIVLVCLSVDSLRRVVLAQWKVSFQGIYFQMFGHFRVFMLQI